MPSWQKKKYFKLAKGFYGRVKNCIRLCAPKVEKSLQYAYISRRLRPRDIRTGWITNISAAVQEHNINYSKFIYGLNVSNMDFNRKILAELAQTEPFSFKAIVDEAKVQGKYSEKISKDMPYMEAIKLGYIVEAPLNEKPIPEQENYIIQSPEGLFKK